MRTGTPTRCSRRRPAERGRGSFRSLSSGDSSPGRYRDAGVPAEPTRAHPAAVRAPRATRPHAARPSTATGTLDARSATAMSAWSRPTVGSSSRRGIAGDSGRARPPTIPATRPHIVSGAARGTATRLAGSATRGMEPNTGMSTGATPTCAAAVTPSTSRIQSGPRSRAVIGRASSVMPRLAAHDNRNPTWCRRNGSASSSTVAANASTRTPAAGRPRCPATNASTAIAMARSTDGSHRVMVPNAISNASAATTRPRRPSRRSSGTKQREHERDVLARDCGQVGEAGGPELLREHLGHATGVAEEEAGQQRPVGGPEVLRTGEHQRPGVVGQPREGRPGGCDAQHVGGVESPDGVLPPPAFVEALERREPPAQHHPLPRREQAQVAGDVTRGVDQNAPVPPAATVEAVDADQRPHVEPRRVGIVDEGGDKMRVGMARDHGPERGRVEAVERPLHRRAAEQRERDQCHADPLRRRAEAPRDEDADDADHERTGRGRGTGRLAREDADDDRAEDRQRPVRHRTVQRLTRSRAAPARRSACRRCRGRCAGRSPT